MANINTKFPTNTPRQLKLIKTRLLMKRLKKTLLVVICLTMVLSVFVVNTPDVHAANTTISAASLQISDSRPSVPATYLFTYTPSDTSDNIATILVNFCTTAVGTCTLPGGFTMAATPTVTVKFNTTTEANTSAFSGTTLTITITTPAAQINAVTISVPILTNDNSIGTFYPNITAKNGGTTYDYGVTPGAIVNGIGVGGSIDQNLTFTVAGLTAATAANTGADINESNGAGQSTSASTLVFGDIASFSTTNLLQQTITITTNAGSGYSVYLWETQALTSGSNTITNGPGGGSPATWTNNNTNGFAVNVTTAATSCAAGNFAIGATFTSNTQYAPIPISPSFPPPGILLGSYTGMSNTSGDKACINYKLSLPANQQPGSYSNIVEYVAVPKY